MIVRYIDGMASLSRNFMRLAVEEPIIVDAAMGVVAEIVKKNVKALYGDASRLEALADSTQAHRVQMGYSANDPLLLDGTLLRDQVYSTHIGSVAEVGTPEIINAYHELGYVDAKGGVSVPPRPVFKYGVADSEKEIGVLFEGVGEIVFGPRRI
jgi:hypothetical protein